MVVISDIPASMETDMNIFKINDHNAITLLDDIPAGKKFYEDYLVGISNDFGYDEIIQIIKKGFEDKHGNHVGKIITMALLGHGKDLVQKPLYEFVFNGTTLQEVSHPSTQMFMFSIEANLGSYLVNKVYSRYMSIDDAIRLMTYIAMQYSSMHAIGTDFSIVIVSKTGVRILTSEEVKNTVLLMESVNLEIRKDCCTLFTSEVSKQ